MEPIFDRLPPPPPGKSGWPWEMTDCREDASGEWPRITVVTPSYQQGEFLEQTIRSVLLQGYPNLEYYVLDGGSRDSSVEIIRKYEPWLKEWRSHRDEGQTATINEGWARSSGEILAWINSDDWYLPGALFSAAKAFLQDRSRVWVGGGVDDCKMDGSFLKRHEAFGVSLAECLGRNAGGYHQPGMFWARRLIDEIGLLDPKLHFAFDHDFWVRTQLAGYTFVAIDKPVACFRRHDSSKSMSRHDLFIEEDWLVFRRYADKVSPEVRRAAELELKRYNADVLLDIVYSKLAEQGRVKALKMLLSQWPIWSHVQPQKLLVGALLRCLTSGSPAPWYREKRGSVAKAHAL